MKYHNHIYEDKQKIVSVEKQDSFLLIEVEDTIFYPGGGGQPHDTGIIKNNNFNGEVVEVFKQDNKIIHKVKVSKGNLKVGEHVILKINKENREKIIRMHTGEHVFYKSLEKAIKDLKLKKIDLDLEESSIFVDAVNLTWDDVFKAEELANSLIEKDLPIIEHIMTRDEAINFDKLRIKAERIKSDTIRIIEVKDFDYSACMGCHAKTTGFVGNILVTNFHQAKGGYEIRFKANVKKDLFELAKSARKTASFLNTSHDQVLDKIKKLIEESEQYKEKFRELSIMLLNNYKTEKIKNIDFIYAVVEDIEKKQLIDKLNELLKEKTIVCFISKQGERATIIINSSDDLKLNTPELMNKVLAKFNGKGGGKDSFAMGSVDSGKVDEFLKCLKEELQR